MFWSQSWICKHWSDLARLGFYHLSRLTVQRANPTNFHIWQLRVNTSTQQPVQQCSTYHCANFARRHECQSNSHILIGGKFVKNFVRWQGVSHCNMSTSFVLTSSWGQEHWNQQIFPQREGYFFCFTDCKFQFPAMVQFGGGRVENLLLLVRR